MRDDTHVELRAKSDPWANGGYLLDAILIGLGLMTLYSILLGI